MAPTPETRTRLLADRRYAVRDLRYHRLGYDFDDERNKVSGLLDMCDALVGSDHKIVVVECGKGLTAEVFAQYSNDVITYCLEAQTIKGRNNDRRARKRLGRYTNVERRMADTHAAAAADFSDGEVQLVYLDCVYVNKKTALEAIHTWAPKTVWLGGHNYCETDDVPGPDVARAVINALGQRVDSFNDGSWVKSVNWHAGYLVN